MPLFTWDMKSEGSGLKNVEDPVPAKDSFKDLNVALVYQWTEANYLTSSGSAFAQLYSYKRANQKLDCGIDNQKAGEPYGLFEQPLDQTSAWKGDDFKQFIDVT